MANSKYLNQVFEGRWKVTEFSDGKFELTNIYNNNKVLIYKTQFYRIVKGESTVSQIITFRLVKTKKDKWNKMTPKKYTKSLTMMRRKETYGG